MGQNTSSCGGLLSEEHAKHHRLSTCPKNQLVNGSHLFGSLVAPTIGVTASLRCSPSSHWPSTRLGLQQLLQGLLGATSSTGPCPGPRTVRVKMKGHSPECFNRHGRGINEDGKGQGAEGDSRIWPCTVE